MKLSKRAEGASTEARRSHHAALSVKMAGIPALSVMLTILSAVSAMLAGCSNDECLENRNARPVAAVYNYLEPDKQIRLDSIMVYGVGAPKGSAMVDSTASFQDFYLPFDLESDTTRVVFRYMQKQLRQYDLRDTLTIIYSRLPYFVSPACGASYRYLIQETRHTRFLLDSVAVPEPTVSNFQMTNIQLFFPVRTASSEQQAPSLEGTRR